MIAQSVALILRAMGAQGGVPTDAPALRVIDRPASRTFDPDAEKEMAVARWYMITKHDPVGAINRLKIVVSQHRGSTQVEEALDCLVEAYMMLGIVADAHRLLRSEGIAPHANPGSWITRALD
jgi:hypothetical protein